MCPSHHMFNHPRKECALGNWDSCRGCLSWILLCWPCKHLGHRCGLFHELWRGAFHRHSPGPIETPPCVKRIWGTRLKKLLPKNSLTLVQALYETRHVMDEWINPFDELPSQDPSPLPSPVTTPWVSLEYLPLEFNFVLFSKEDMFLVVQLDMEHKHNGNSIVAIRWIFLSRRRCLWKILFTRIDWSLDRITSRFVS